MHSDLRERAEAYVLARRVTPALACQEIYYNSTFCCRRYVNVITSQEVLNYGTQVSIYSSPVSVIYSRLTLPMII